MSEASQLDLKRLAVGLARHASVKWPEVVTSEDVDRLQASVDVTLVGLRVISSIMIRLGMDPSVIKRAAADATVPETIEVSSSDVTAIMGDEIREMRLPTPLNLLAQIDAASITMDRELLPRWFWEAYYPALLRRLAGRSAPTPRDHAILARMVEMLVSPRK